MALYKNYKLSDLTYYKTGGLCQTLYQPESKKELREALATIEKEKQDFYILGVGSNSLVSDEKWEGAVINLSKMKHIELRDDNVIIAGAGVTNFELAEFALQHKLGGAAWMYGLPGSLGATVRMNARCYGGEISQIVTKIISYTRTAQEKEYLNDKESKTLFKGYKETVFMSNQEIIAEVEVTLFLSDSPSIKGKMISCYEDRKSKGQYDNPSCGCVFKNDYRKEVSVPSGLLIDHCQLKGFAHGKATVSPGHANFIHNTGSASSREILELSLLIREKVWEATGVWMEYEMEILGALPEDLKERVSEKRPENFKTEVLEKLREKFQKARKP